MAGIPATSVARVPHYQSLVVVARAGLRPWRREFFMEKTVSDLPADDAELLDLGSVLGQNLTFGLVAGRCSAAQAASLRRLREERLYKRVAPNWREFCPTFLKMSRTQADQVIQLLDEFGPGYFELAQLTRVSAETYRAIAPSIQEGVLHSRRRHRANCGELP